MTTKRECHRDFLEAAPENRWKGKLDVLFSELVRRAREHRKSADEVRNGFGWSWVVLPGGAMVAMRVRSDDADRLELRIARRDAPHPEAWGKWENEVAVFLRQFCIEPLDGTTPARIPTGAFYRLPSQEGKPVVTLTELHIGEVAPGKAICARCLEKTGELKVIDWWAPGGVSGQRCEPCARSKSS